MSSLREEAGYMDFSAAVEAERRHRTGWAFTSGLGSLEGLKDFAGDHGLAWTSPVAQTRYYLAACRVQGIAPGGSFPWDRWWQEPLERERDEIVESIPWAD